MLTNIVRSFNKHRKQRFRDDIKIVARRLEQDSHSFCQCTDGDGNALFNKYQLKVMMGKLRPPPCPTPYKVKIDTEDGDGSERPPPEKQKR
jgi:hypothetical protein